LLKLDGSSVVGTDSGITSAADIFGGVDTGAGTMGYSYSIYTGENNLGVGPFVQNNSVVNNASLNNSRVNNLGPDLMGLKNLGASMADFNGSEAGFLGLGNSEGSMFRQIITGAINLGRDNFGVANRGYL
jgi:hypothetical protein